MRGQRRAAPPPAATVYLDWMDRSVSPGADFFRFANGGWLKAHPIPPDRSYWGVDSVLEQQNQTFIRDLVESLAQGGLGRRAVRSARLPISIASGMDEKAIDAAGAAPLAAGARAHRRHPHVADDLEEEIAHLQTIGVAAPLSLGQMQDFKDSTRVIAVASQSGLGSAESRLLLEERADLQGGAQPPTSRTWHACWRCSAMRRPWPARESKAVMALETRWRDASMSDVEQRNPHAVYHPMTLDEAQAIDAASRLAVDCCCAPDIRRSHRSTSACRNSSARSTASSRDTLDRGLEDLSALATPRRLRAVSV